MTQPQQRWMPTLQTLKAVVRTPCCWQEALFCRGVHPSCWVDPEWACSETKMVGHHTEVSHIQMIFSHIWSGRILLNHCRSWFCVIIPQQCPDVFVFFFLWIVLRERLTERELDFLNLPVSSLHHSCNRDRLSMTTDELLSIPHDGSMPVTHTSAFVQGF